MTISAPSHSILLKLFRPALRFCIRRSIRIQEIEEAVHQAFVELAIDEAKRSGRKVNVSSLAVMTGMHRREIRRLYVDDTPEPRSVNFITRLLGHWQSAEPFITKSGKPRILSCRGDDNEFRHLLSCVSQDLNAGTVIKELERLNYVEATPRGLKLVTQAHVVSEDLEAAFRIVDDDATSLINAVCQNIEQNSEIPNLHGRTEFDAIPVSDIPKVKAWLYEEGSKFQNRVQKYLSRYDKGEQVSEPDYGRVSFTSFSYADNVTESN